jgi:hypothetical protein
MNQKTLCDMLNLRKLGIINFNMQDESGESLLKKTREMFAHVQNAYIREEELPVTRLTPEAREDSMKVAKEIWIESMKLLAGKDENVRRDSNNHALILKGKKGLEDTMFKGADLVVDRYHFEYEGDITHTKQEHYAFYLDNVLKTTRNSADTEEGKIFPPKGSAVEKHEANRDELAELLEVVKSSTQFKS